MKILTVTKFTIPDISKPLDNSEKVSTYLISKQAREKVSTCLISNQADRFYYVRTQMIKTVLGRPCRVSRRRSEEHTSELQSH